MSMFIIPIVQQLIGWHPIALAGHNWPPPNPLNASMITLSCYNFLLKEFAKIKMYEMALCSSVLSHAVLYCFENYYYKNNLKTTKYGHKTGVTLPKRYCIFENR